MLHGGFFTKYLVVKTATNLCGCTEGASCDRKINKLSEKLKIIWWLQNQVISTSLFEERELDPIFAWICGQKSEGVCSQFLKWSQLDLEFTRCQSCRRFLRKVMKQILPWVITRWIISKNQLLRCKDEMKNFRWSRR